MEWKQGTPVGEYQILGELDRGSKGILYTVRHVGTQEAAVMVALQDPGLMKSGRLTELESASGLEHPNLATIKELWTFDDFVFIVSGSAEGRSLQDFSTSHAEGRPEAASSDDSLQVVEAAALMREVARALDFAHGHNLAYHDLRERDIVICPGGAPVIMGLGWMPLLERPPEDNAISYTLEDPEDRPAGPGWDVRSAGRILCRLLAGEEAVSAGAPDLPEAMREIVQRATTCDPECRYYDAESLSRDLDGFIAGYDPPIAFEKTEPQAAAMERDRGIKDLLSIGAGRDPSPSSPESSFWSGLALSVLVLAIFVFVLVASLAVSGVLPRTIQKLSLEVRTSNFEEAVASSRHLEEPGIRIEKLASLLAATPGLPGSAWTRIELGRLYLKQGYWEDALSQILIALHMQPSLVKGQDLLDLAALLYDHGQTAQSDWILNRIIDGYQGSEPAWRAIFLKKRLTLDRSALNAVVREIKALLEGPLKRRAALRDQGECLGKLAGSITLQNKLRMGEQRVIGDFLPPPGDEIAAFDGDRIRVSCPEEEVEWLLEEAPLHLWAADLDGSGREKILLGYPSGRIDIHDPRPGSLERSIHLRGRLHREVLVFTGSKGDHLLLVPLTVRDEVNLVLIPTDRVDTPEGIEYRSLDGQEVTALLAADLIEDSPGEEIVVVTLGRQGSLINVLAVETRAGDRGVLHQQVIPGEVSRAVKLTDSRILLGLSTWYVSEGVEPNGRKERAGLFFLEKPHSPNNGSSARSSLYSNLEPVKILESPAGGRGAIILDACGGEFMGGGATLAAFLVRFPGWLEFEPETRLLLVDREGVCTWFHCPGAAALHTGKFNPEDAESLVVDIRSSLLGVTF